MRKYNIFLWGAVFVVATVTAVAISTYEPTIYPLDFTPQQNVVRQPAIFHLNEAVDVEAVFKNTTAQAVTFTAAIHWVLVNPDATKVDATERDVIQLGLLETINPGCTELAFSNHAPDEVAAITKQLFSQGYKSVSWKLSGDNVIIMPKDAGTKPFKVDEFAFIPDGVALPAYKVEDKVQC